MPLGIGGRKSFSYPRAERRIPMEVGVQISGHSEFPGVETTFTENVSSQGARVYHSRQWQLNDSLRSRPYGGVSGFGARCLLPSDARARDSWWGWNLCSLKGAGWLARLFRAVAPREFEKAFDVFASLTRQFRI